MEIRGKVAVVTGAGSGIGEAVAKELAARDVKGLALVDRCAESLERVRTSLTSEAMAFQGDVSDAAFRGRVFDEASRRWGDVPRICVPAAGITRDALSVKLDKATGEASLYDVERFHQVLEVNLVAPVYWAMEMVKRIAEDRFAKKLGAWPDPSDAPVQIDHSEVKDVTGTVIFIGSVSRQGNKGQIAYAATKAGLEGAAATLMTEAIYYGVRCGVIHPGFTATPMVRAMQQEYINTRILPFTALRRLIYPEEIADAICFMVANSAVSGELWADAGWHPSA